MPRKDGAFRAKFVSLVKIAALQASERRMRELIDSTPLAPVLEARRLVREPRFRAGDNDTGETRNAALRVKLIKDHKYILRVRVYYQERPAQCALDRNRASSDACPAERLLRSMSGRWDR